MKALINTILEQTQAYVDYVTEDNGDYCEQYDLFLADDSTFHNDQWENAILSALELDCIEPHIMDDMIMAIVDNPTGYSSNQIKHGYFWADDLCCASFAIGELELYEQWYSPFAGGIAEYLNKNSDYYYTANDDKISCYINLSDVTVAYVLIPAEIKELYQITASNYDESER